MDLNNENILHVKNSDVEYLQFKELLKYADKLQIPYVIVIGEDEIQTQKIKIKNMKSGEEIEASFDAKAIEEKIC